MDKHKIRSRLLDAQVEAGISHTLLEALRAGQTAIALELLEHRLDVSILTIHDYIGGVEPAERTEVAKLLRKFRQYRHQHPRKTEAVFPVEAQEDLETQERVRTILDETPDV